MPSARSIAGGELGKSTCYAAPLVCSNKDGHQKATVAQEDHVERRTLSSARANSRVIGHQAGRRRGHISLASHHHINPFPHGGAYRCRNADARRLSRTDHQTAGGHRNQAGAAGAVGAQVAAKCQTRTAILRLPHPSIYGFAEVDPLFGRQPNLTNADFIRSRLCRRSLRHIVNDQHLQKLEGISRRAKGEARYDHFSVLRRALRRALAHPMALFMKAAGD